MPGMYAVTSTPVVSRTRATLRSAEFGFFGVCVKHARADAAALGRALERRRLGLLGLGLPSLADELGDRGHACSFARFSDELRGTGAREVAHDPSTSTAGRGRGLPKPTKQDISGPPMPPARADRGGEPEIASVLKIRAPICRYGGGRPERPVEVVASTRSHPVREVLCSNRRFVLCRRRGHRQQRRSRRRNDCGPFYERPLSLCR